MIKTIIKAKTKDIIVKNIKFKMIFNFLKKTHRFYY